MTVEIEFRVTPEELDLFRSAHPAPASDFLESIIDCPWAEFQIVIDGFELLPWTGQIGLLQMPMAFDRILQELELPGERTAIFGNDTETTLSFVRQRATLHVSAQVGTAAASRAATDVESWRQALHSLRQRVCFYAESAIPQIFEQPDVGLWRLRGSV